MHIFFRRPSAFTRCLMITFSLLYVLSSPAYGYDPGSEDDIERELRELEMKHSPSSEAETKTDSDTKTDAFTPRPASTSNSTSNSAPGMLSSMNPDIALIADFALAGFIGRPELVGGHDPGQVGFNLQGLELAISSSIDPYFRFDSSILLGLFGLEIEEAYGTTLGLGWGFQARAGQYMSAFGRANPTHVHQWDFVTQALIIGKFFGSEGMRGLGAELSQVLPLPWYVNWKVGVQNIAGESTGRSFLSSEADIETLLDLTVIGRLEQFFELSSSIEMLWGLSVANGANSSGRGNRTDIYGTDLLLKWYPATEGGRQSISWQTEAMLRRRQSPGTANEPEGDVLQDFGGYSQLSWQLNASWQLAGRYEFVEGIQHDYLDPDWTRARQRGALALTFYPSHFSRLRAEYNLDHLAYRDASSERLTHAMFLQLELVAGAHGAHTY